MRALGPDAFSAKLYSVFFAIGSVLLLVWIGALLRSQIYGIAAGLVFLFTREFVMNSAGFHLDSGMLFFILLSFALWIRGNPIAAGVAVGLGTWMKSPAAFLLFPVTAVFLLSARITLEERKLRIQSFFFSFLAAVSVTALFWVIVGSLAGPEMVWDYWKRQVWGTAVSGRGGQALHLMYFPELLFASYWPWLPFAIWGAIRSLREDSFRELRISLPLLGVLAGTVFFTSMKFKYSYYFLPVYPFLALLAVEGLRPWIEAHSNLFGKIVVSLGLLVPAVLLATPIPQGKEPYPSMRLFAPEIEARSASCEDEILLISGGEETGSSLDLIYHSVFYTGLRTHRMECAEAEAFLSEESGSRVRFVIGEASSFERCLSEGSRKRFGEEIRYQNRALRTQEPRRVEPDLKHALSASTRCTR
jgi:hypothetical protein